MQRLLLIESSPTLRRGMQNVLARHGFDVASVDACEGSVDQVERELAQGLSVVLLGWTTAPDTVCHALVRRLGRPDCRHLALVILVSDSDRVSQRALTERPFTVIRRWQHPSEVPRLARSLLARIARETRRRIEPNTSLKILLVDDSRTSRATYQRLLKDHGYAVVTCEDAEDALALVETERFDLAIIDYYMPGLNGAQLCRALRDLPATRELSLAVLTSSYEDGLISDCLAAGASECMFKNESNELLLARIDSMARLRQRELHLEGERQRLELTLASVGDGVYGVDREGRISFVNPATLRLLQWSHADELVGLLAHERIHYADDRGRRIPSDTCFLHQAYELGDSLSNWETVFWRSDGQPVTVECTVRPQQQEGECTGVVVAFRDITERKRLEAEMQWQLRHDHLTQLFNRQHFESMLEHELARLKRSTEQSALLFIDLDRFKQINDTGGHAAGDALLVNIGQKLKSRTRQSDVVARLAGDEFAVLLRKVDVASILALADQYRSILDEMQFVHAGRAFDVSGSVGICALHRHTATPAHALNCADAACQIAKRQGRNRIHMFDARDDAPALAALEESWSQRLREALADNAFTLQFQPIVDLRRLPADAFSGDDWQQRLVQLVPTALYGYEVFVRLHDADTRLAPFAFLPQAERFELLPALDGWVLNRLATMLAERQAARGTRLHVNVAGVSLQDPGYRARLAALLREGVFAPGQLCLELKESDPTSHLMSLLPALNELTQSGLRLMLDEYGRGFGAVGSLRGLPLASVKLDGSLVQTLTRDALNETVLRAMTGVAHAMDLVVIAPLVEDAETLRRLRAAGADCAQGFAIGHPADAWVARPS